MDYSKNNFYLSILNDKKMNIELEVPYQINRLSECFKNNLIEFSDLGNHLNRLIGKEKAEYYLNIIKDSPEKPQLSKEFNFHQILKRTDELLAEYNKVNKQILSQQQLINNYESDKNNNSITNNLNLNNDLSEPYSKSNSGNIGRRNLKANQNSILKKCNCKEIFGKDVFPFNLMEFLSKNGDQHMTDSCNENCIFLIIKKYQELIEYSNNKIFFLRALKTSSQNNGYFKGVEDIGFIEFNQYMENLLHPISPMHKKVEDAIKFKIHNKTITVNEENKNNVPYGFWLNNNNISYEITNETPIK